MTKTKEITSSDQEKVFKWLWPDKCYHKEDQSKMTGDSIMISLQGYCGKCGIVLWIEGKHDSVICNPDFTDYDGMGKILEELEKRSYLIDIASRPDEHEHGWTCELYRVICADSGEEPWSTAPLAVLNALLSLIEKEKV